MTKTKPANIQLEESILTMVRAAFAGEFKGRQFTTERHLRSPALVASMVASAAARRTKKALFRSKQAGFAPALTSKE